MTTIIVIFRDLTTKYAKIAAMTEGILVQIARLESRILSTEVCLIVGILMKIAGGRPEAVETYCELGRPRVIFAKFTD